jgi:hypothetical protein
MKTVHVLLALTLLVIAACAPGANSFVDTPSTHGVVAGFWLGLWHGLISPITFIISLFTDSVEIYEVHNNGSWYNLGFILGAGSLCGGSGSRFCSKRK